MGLVEQPFGWESAIVWCFILALIFLWGFYPWRDGE